MGLILEGRCVVPGTARGELLFSAHPISFCFGVAPETGIIQDIRHDLAGESMAGKILAFPAGKGSSGAGLVILELIRNKVAPLALINIRTEAVLASGPIVARHFLNESVPIINLDGESFMRLKGAAEVKLDAGAGRVEILGRFSNRSPSPGLTGTEEC